ncbi:MBL fold metallo-hydrolase [Amycolatopsis sp. MtRt-6]|uniref:MBL fold metallo-hydrolase n=1 Tax=Amycolatopsis sp. MtRt-6 TaxID=2792782 RepID=UPI001A908154|nr:MBL fold metallo-hydrolase [Amycolatopsis sp. MtRt-6]
MTAPGAGTVRVTFAGSGDAFGSGGRLQACIHVQAAGSPPVLLDCGATSLVALKRQGLDPGDVAAVFVSHRHVDHFGGVPHLILDGQFTRRTAPLTVVGPPGTTGWLTEAMEIMFPGSSTARRRFPVEVVELRPGGHPAVVGVVSARGWEVNHGMAGGPFLGLRLELAGVVIGYTGDTAWTDSLADVAAGTDLFIAESYFWDKAVPFHLRHADLVAHRHELTGKRVVLTHMSTDMLAHADEAAFELAHDGLRVDLKA